MIISPDTISYFIFGKVFDEKSVKKLAIFNDIDFPQSLEKNIKNSLQHNHKTTDKTYSKIKEFFIKLTNNDEYFLRKANSTNLSKEINLSTSEKLLYFTEEKYLSFLQASGLTNTFIHKELEHLFRISRDILTLTNKNIPEKEIDDILEKADLSSKLKLSNDFYIDLSTLGITHNRFSLNISLYLMACFEITNNEYEYLSFQDIINNILPNIENRKIESSFYYYIEFWHKYNDRKGIKKVSDEDISEILGIDPSTFSRYKKGRRVLNNTQYIKNIMKHSGLIYHYILFWNNFLQKTNELNCLSLVKPYLTKNYSQYISLAKSRLTMYEKETN